MVDTMRVNSHHQSEINDGKVVAIGNECAAAAAGVLDFDTLNDTLYGFYTMRDIEIIAVEHIVVEEHACDTIAGIASLTDGTTVFATVTAVDETAAHGHISGVLGTTVEVPENTMLYFKTTTETTDDSGAATAGEGYFIVEYR